MMDSTAGCFFGCLFKIFLFCLLVILPIVGIVWWFVTKTPMQFMFTCIGIALAWAGLGAGYFFWRFHEHN